MKPGKAYYAGAARAVVQGVPIRLAKKPSAANKAKIGSGTIQDPDFSTRAERAHERKVRNKWEIQTYSEMLGISYFSALRKAVRQRAYMAANPPLDISLEYDI